MPNLQRIRGLLRESASLDDVVYCGSLVSELQGAGAWLLREEVLRCALDDDWLEQELCASIERFLENPRLPDQPGSAHALIVWQDWQVESPLRRAFALPLQWHRGDRDSPRLPEALRALAASIRADCGLQESSWRLRLDPAAGLARTDLSDWSLSAGSAWAPLVAGLLLADFGGAPQPTTMATARWEGGRIREVDDVEHKLEAALWLGCQHFYLPAANAGELHHLSEQMREAIEAGASSDGVDLHYLAPGRARDAQSALGDLLFRLELEPTFDQQLEDEERARSFERCRLYAMRMPFRFRERYIQEHIVEERARQQRESARAALGFEEDEVPDVLILLLSQVSSGLLSILTLEPKRAVVLVSTRDERKRAKLVELCGARELEVDFGPEADWPLLLDVDLFDEVEQATAQQVDSFVEGSHSIVVDVTGGTKGMTVSAGLAAFRRRVPTIHVHSTWENGARSIGTERIFVISAIEEHEP